MNTVTISAKVPTEITDKILQTGYPVSNLIQASLYIFLEMDKDEQDSYMLRFLQEKKLNRALDRYLNQKNQAFSADKKIAINF